MALLEVPRTEPSAHVPSEEGSDHGGRTPRHRFLSGRARAAVKRTVQFVEEHYGESVLLTNLARELGISIFALSRAFKRIMRVSFRRFLLEVRIAKAQDLLRDRDHSITDIAQMVGFGDLPRFDKTFKRRVGTSPSRYRAHVLQTPSLQETTSISLVSAATIGRRRSRLKRRHLRAS